MISHEGEAMPASEAITPVQARSTDLADIGTGSAILPSRKAEPGMQCSHDRAKSVGAVPGFETRKRTSMFDVLAGKKHNHDQIPHAMIAHKHVDSGLPVQSAHSPAGPCEVSPSPKRCWSDVKKLRNRTMPTLPAPLVIMPRSMVPNTV